jgi:hypothetical protein
LAFGAFACSDAPKDTASPDETRPSSVDAGNEEIVSPESLISLLKSIKDYRFTQVWPSVVARREAALESNPQMAAAIDELVSRAVVDRTTGRALKVGVTFIVMKTAIDDATKSSQASQFQGFPTETISYLGTEIIVAGQPGAHWATSMIPSDNIIVSTQGLDREAVLSVSKAIVDALGEPSM